VPLLPFKVNAVAGCPPWSTLTGSRVGHPSKGSGGSGLGALAVEILVTTFSTIFAMTVIAQHRTDTAASFAQHTQERAPELKVRPADSRCWRSTFRACLRVRGVNSDSDYFMPVACVCDSAVWCRSRGKYSIVNCLPIWAA
jgi:hypothetical protein